MEQAPHATPRAGRVAAGLLACLITSLGATAVAADPGVTGSEIRLGNTMPYSGPASAYGVTGRAQDAYFRMVDDQGGVNGRKITLTSLDDGYSPPRAVETVRRLVEEDEVLADFGSFGTVTNLAVARYLNARKVPQLFVFSGSRSFADPKALPWSTAFLPSYYDESVLYAKWVLATKPDARIAILSQDDDAGRTFLDGFRAGLGDQANRIVAAKSYQVTDPTIDSQIVSFQTAGADVLFDAATPKFAAQALRRAAEIGWHPLIVLPSVSNSVSGVLAPAGLAAATGIVTGEYLKDPNDPAWADDPDMRAWRAWMAKYQPGGDTGDVLNVAGYASAALMTEVLRRAGDDLGRAHVMSVATHLQGVTVPMVLPGITVATTPERTTPIRQLRLARFDGHSWVLFGDVLGQ